MVCIQSWWQVIHAIFLSFPVVSKMAYSSFVVDVFAEFVQRMRVLFGLFFHVLQLLLIRFTQRNLCWISKSKMKLQQKLD